LTAGWISTCRSRRNASAGCILLRGETDQGAMARCLLWQGVLGAAVLGSMCCCCEGPCAAYPGMQVCTSTVVSSRCDCCSCCGPTWLLYIGQISVRALLPAEWGAAEHGVPTQATPAAILLHTNGCCAAGCISGSGGAQCQHCTLGAKSSPVAAVLCRGTRSRWAGTRGAACARLAVD
jgi:hypothetical protein